jgi:hypothetical protein
MWKCNMNRNWSPLLIAMTLFLESACGGGGGDPKACDTSAHAGILIRVIDNASGNPIACGASAVVISGSYSETVNSNTPCSDNTNLMAAFERPGTYAITVSKAGYQNFTINDVIVTPGVCHVNTVTVDARLSVI